MTLLLELLLEPGEVLLYVYFKGVRLLLPNSKVLVPVSIVLIGDKCSKPPWLPAVGVCVTHTTCSSRLLIVGSYNLAC